MLRTLILLIVFSSCLFLPACNTGTDSENAASSAIVEPELIASRIRANPDALCPYQSVRAWANIVMEYSFQKLVTKHPVTLMPEPILAKSLPTITPITEGKNEGGYVLEFEIREEAKWDNGTPITAQDYLTSMKIVFNPAGGKYLPLYQEILNYIDDIQIDESNPKRFTVITRSGNFNMLDNIAYYVIPAYAYDPDGVLNEFTFSDFTNPEKAKTFKDNEKLKAFDAAFQAPENSQNVENVIGSGPYQVSSWNQNQDITLTKKDNWWGASLAAANPMFQAYAKNIRFDIIRDETAVIANVKNGSIDIAQTISGAAFNDLKDNEYVNENFRFETPRTLMANYMGMNGKHPKLRDARVRKAISCLINREEMVKTVYHGYAEPLYGPIMPVSAYKEYALNSKKYAFDPEKARALLAEAGWTDSNGNGIVDKVIDGKSTELELSILTTSSNVIVNQILLFLQPDFKSAGVSLVQKVTEPRQMSAARSKGEFEIMTSASVYDGSYYNVYQYYHTESPYNFFGAGDAELDKIIDDIRLTVDPAQIATKMKAFQEKVNEGQNLIFLTVPFERILVNKKLKNLEVGILRPNFRASTAHL